MRVIIDGRIKDQETIKLNLFSSAVHQGMGLKQNILYHKGRLYWYDEHIKKLEETARFCKFVVNFNHLEEEKIHTLLGYNGLSDNDALVKILCLPDIGHCRTIILATQYNLPDIETNASIHNEPVTSVLNKFCTINNKGKSFWLEHYAMTNSTEQVLFTNIKNRIIEGFESNIIALWNKNLYYVYPSQPYYQYIVQEKILKAATKKLGIKKLIAKGKGLSLELLEKADEVVLINDIFIARRITEIVSYTGRKIPLRSKNFAEKLREYFL